jgi:phosphatidylglycerophosphate synthase
MKKIPILLILFRFILAPIILLLAYFLRDKASIAIIILMYLGLISDIFDGIIARNMGISSAKLRRLDSQTDMVFWVCIGISAYFIYPEIIIANKISIIIIFGMEALCYITSLAKFGKETCTHAFLAKMWGLSLLVAFTLLIGFQYSGIPFYTAVVLGYISHIDRILITLILPKWAHDIPSSYHAFLMRKGIPFKKYKLFN